MQRLRTQVDRIDLEILKLLQQRTKLSRRIGETKRRHGAVVYVPERERELLRRVGRLSRGKLPARSVTAIYREILSSSREAQGQGAIGFLRAGAAAVLPTARWCFGASGDFLPAKSWSELAGGLAKNSLALALLTGADLANLLSTSRTRTDFLEQFLVVGDLAPQGKCSLAERIFVISPGRNKTDSEANRILVLIECKSTTDAVKSWLNSMPDRSIRIEAEVLNLTSSSRKGSAVLVRLSSARTIKTASLLQSPGMQFSIVGIYGGSEDYGG